MSLNPFEDASEQAQAEASEASEIVLANVEAVSDDDSVVAVTNVGKEAKYPARVPEENDTPPVGSSVLVNTAVGGQPFIQQTMSVPEGETLGTAADTITTYFQDTEPTNASEGDRWFVERLGDIDWITYQLDDINTKLFDIDGNIYAGGNLGHVFQYDKNSGEVTRRYTGTRNSRVSEIHVDADYVFLSNVSGELVAFDRSTGSEQWRVTGIGDGVEWSMTADDTSVYVGTFSDTVYSYDKSTGTQNWTKATGGSPDALAVDDASLYFGDFDGTFYSLDKSSGGENWTYTTGTAHGRSVIVDDTSVYFGDVGGTIYSLDKSAGTENWTYIVSGSRADSRIATDGTYLYFGDDTPAVYSVAKSDGSENWAFNTGGGGEYVEGFAVDDSNVYFARNTDDLLAASKSAREISYHFNLDDANEDSNSGIVADGSNVYFGTSDGGLYCIAVADAYKGYVYDGTNWNTVV